MSENRLAAETRSEFGKGFARRARKAGKIPAVLYGHGTDPRHVSLPAREFAHVMKGGANTILTLELEGGDTELALPKSVVRHPLRDYVEHVDLLLVRRGEKITVDVQIVVTGEAVPGSLVLTDANSIAIEVDALEIPESLEVSVAGAEIGTQILAGQVALPAGATLATDPEALVVAVNAAPTEADMDESGEGAAATGAQPVAEAAEGSEESGSGES